MKATRRNGRAGQKGTYNIKHNDRNFDVKNSDHIDEERVAQNVYWDCYQGYCFAGSDEPRKYTFSDVERAFYFENYEEHVLAQNERNEAARHKERNRTIDDVLKNKNTCPEKSVILLKEIWFLRIKRSCPGELPMQHRIPNILCLHIMMISHLSR